MQVQRASTGPKAPATKIKPDPVKMKPAPKTAAAAVARTTPASAASPACAQSDAGEKAKALIRQVIAEELSNPENEHIRRLMTDTVVSVLSRPPRLVDDSLQDRVLRSVAAISASERQRLLDEIFAMINRER